MTDKSKPGIIFRALQITNEQRNAYGLRYNDYQRYRKHCGNRTHRLRSTLKMTHGKGREFKKLSPMNPDSVNEGHLQLLLFEAERAWAHAQDVTNTSLQPSNKQKVSTLRHSATSRFRRAVNWAAKLLSLCQTLYADSRLSAENLIEVTVYTVILNGRFLRYRDDFEDALIQLSVARGLLDELAQSAPTSRDQALAILFADEIGPEIRYCAHELGHSRAYDVSSIVAELSPKYRSQIVENYDTLLLKLKQAQKGKSESQANLTERLWEGQPVPVRYPELVDVFLRVVAAELALEKSGVKKSKTGVTAYDAVLSSLSDAEGVARKLQETQQLAGTNVASISQGRDIHFVHAYTVYQLLSRRIQRDLLLMNTLLASVGVEKSKASGVSKPANPSTSSSKPDVDSRLYPAVVKLLDTVIQSLTQMRSLSIVDDNPDLASAVDARLSFSKGRRCIYLAQCYSTVKKYAEALLLLQHATIYVRETHSNLALSESDVINSGTPSYFPLSNDDAREIEKSVASDSLNHKRDWFAYNGGSVDADPATHKKPLFFNIALNYVQLDMDRLHERAGKRKQPTAKIAPTMNPPREQATEKKVVPKAKAEVPEVIPTTVSQPARGGLSSLLGGWWR